MTPHFISAKSPSSFSACINSDLSGLVGSSPSAVCPRDNLIINCIANDDLPCPVGPTRSKPPPLHKKRCLMSSPGSLVKLAKHVQAFLPPMEILVDAVDAFYGLGDLRHRD